MRKSSIGESMAAPPCAAIVACGGSEAQSMRHGDTEGRGEGRVARTLVIASAARNLVAVGLPRSTRFLAALAMTNAPWLALFPRHTDEGYAQRRRSHGATGSVSHVA